MRIQRLEKIFTSLLLLLLFGLFYLQIVEGKRHRLQSQENVIRLIPVPAPRGTISDRNGVPLADHRLTFDLAVVPQETRNLAALIETLSGVVGGDPRPLLRAYARNFSTPFMPVKIVEDVLKEKAIQLAERRDLPGLVILVTPHRHYPFGEATAHLLGTLGEIAPNELERLRPYGYRLKDFVGRAGIEESFDNYLRGRDGGIQLKVNNRGHKVATLGHRSAQKGKDVTLTVDVRLQEFLHSLLQGKRGAICVMDVRTGEILGLVSAPSFDPNQDLSAFLDAPFDPFLNRAIQGRYPPGSTFKVVVASAALEEGRLAPESSLSCPGFFKLGNETFRCWREQGHGVEDVRGALQHSCNVFFYRTGLLVGPEPLVTYARLFGLEGPSGVELSHEAGGFLPTPSWKRTVKRENWYEGDTVNLAIGQGYLSVTPIQLLRMVSVIAADGNRVDPYLVKQIGPLEVKRVRKHPLPLSKKTLEVVREGMVRVVNTPDGTGRVAAVEGMEIAGKTGTAQVPGKEPHAWFVGFSPVQDPRICLVVLVEHGGMGGLVASQIASAIFQKIGVLGL